MSRQKSFQSSLYNTAYLTEIFSYLWEKYSKQEEEEEQQQQTNIMYRFSRGQKYTNIEV